MMLLSAKTVYGALKGEYLVRPLQVVSGPKTSLIACRRAAFSHYVIIGFTLYELIIFQMNIIITLILYHMIILHMRSRDRNPRIKSDAGGGPETRVSLGVA